MSDRGQGPSLTSGPPEYFQSSDLSTQTSTLESWRSMANQMQPSRGTGSGGLQPSQIQSQNDAQYLRRFSLVVSDESGSGLELSMLRVNFQITKTTIGTPNRLYAKVYNMSPQTMQKVLAFTNVVVSAGYKFSHFGIIFQGKVVQYTRGKETPVDTYFRIDAGDWDQAHNSAVLIETLPAGSTDKDLLDKHLAEYQKFGAKPEHVEWKTDPPKYDRALTVIKESRKGIRELDLKHGRNTFFDDGKILSIGTDSYRPGEVVVLSPTSGLIGMPEVTPQGIQARCLLNPKLKLGGLVHIDAKFLSGVPYMPGSNNQAGANGDVLKGQTMGGIQRPIALWKEQLESAYTSPTGTYKILMLDYTGDTRGNPWYCELICIAMGSDGSPLWEVNPSSAWRRAAPEATEGVAYGGGEAPPAPA